MQSLHLVKASNCPEITKSSSLLVSSAQDCLTDRTYPCENSLQHCFPPPPFFESTSSQHEAWYDFFILDITGKRLKGNIKLDSCCLHCLANSLFGVNQAIKVILTLRLGNTTTISTSTIRLRTTTTIRFRKTTMIGLQITRGIYSLIIFSKVFSIHHTVLSTCYIESICIVWYTSS